MGDLIDFWLVGCSYQTEGPPEKTKWQMWNAWAPVLNPFSLIIFDFSNHKQQSIAVSPKNGSIANPPQPATN